MREQRAALLQSLWQQGMNGNTAAARLWLDESGAPRAAAGIIELPNIGEGLTDLGE